MNIYSSPQSDQEFAKKTDKIMPPNEFNEVIKAILEGKYSWACVLILRSSGYNPLHYIPYRTYKRLLKENSKNARREVDTGLTHRELSHESCQSINFVQKQTDRASVSL